MAISNLMVSKWDSSGIRTIDFGFLKNGFGTQNLKCDVKIMVLGCEISILEDNFFFSEDNFLDQIFTKILNRNFKFWQSSSYPILSNFYIFDEISNF